MTRDADKQAQRIESACASPSSLGQCMALVTSANLSLTNLMVGYEYADTEEKKTLVADLLDRQLDDMGGCTQASLHSRRLRGCGNSRLPCKERPASAYPAESSKTMATYILYGSKVSPAEAKGILEELLMLQFEARESDYQGEYFRAGNKAGEHFELKKNVDPFDGDPVEMKFPEFPTLLYINATSRSEELKKIVGPARGGFALLRHEDF